MLIVYNFHSILLLQNLGIHWHVWEKSMCYFDQNSFYGLDLYMQIKYEVGI